MIDLHAHILPALDDGPPDIAAALAMARTAVHAGIAELVATPHIDHRFGLGARDVAAATAQLRRQLAERRIPLVLHAGAEVDAARASELNLAELRELRLGDGPWLLLECPLDPHFGELEATVGRLHGLGLRVLLAHPERSPTIQRDPELLERLVAAGALAQLTADSLAGTFGSAARALAVALLRSGLAHCLASDAHDAARRPPRLAGALRGAERALPGASALEPWLTTDAPAALLRGGALPPRPPLGSPRRRGLRAPGRLRAS